MAIFKCKICGGTLEITSGETVAICEYCGTKQTLPKLDDEKKANLFDRANHFRRNNDFDKAMGIYEQILNEDTEDAECYWSIVLCRYGIEYVEDPSSRKRVPTVNRAQFTSVFDDEDYKSAIKYADAHQRELYEKEAAAINEIQKGILAISGQEEPFDIFICYKETDANGCRTQDSVLATELYHELTREGYKVFFSRITLEDKLGTAYEPYIFAALNSSKVMVVLGAKPEHFNAVWVKNEWARYLALIKQGQKKMLIPAYRDMDPYDLPEEFSHLQAQDMSKLGFMQDLVRGITKLVSVDNSTVVKETVVVQNAVSGNTSALVKRGFLALEDGDWNKADDFFEQALNQNAEDAEAYLGKLMAELQVKTQLALKDCKEPFDNSTNYQKAIRFADASLSAELKGYISFIKERNAKKAKEEYNESLYLRAMDEYKSHDVAKLTDAIELFTEIIEWKDSKELIGKCQAKIEQIRVQEENERIERERLAEEKRLEDERKKALKKIEREKARKRNKKLVAIITPIIVIVVAFIIVLNTVIIPNSKYKTAVALMNDGKYTKAISAFELLEGYKDSKSKIQECQILILDSQYNKAISLMNDGLYEEAILAFNTLNDHRASKEKIEECNIEILDQKYVNAISYMNEEKYADAISTFEELNGYKDSEALQIESTYKYALYLISNKDYHKALEYLDIVKGDRDVSDEINTATYGKANQLFESRKHEEAAKLFESLVGYKDSSEKTKECRYLTAKDYVNAYDYAAAKNQFVSISGYKDSDAYIKLIDNIISKVYYNDEYRGTHYIWVVSKIDTESCSEELNFYKCRDDIGTDDEFVDYYQGYNVQWKTSGTKIFASTDGQAAESGYTLYNLSAGRNILTSQYISTDGEAKVVDTYKLMPDGHAQYIKEEWVSYLENNENNNAWKTAEATVDIIDDDSNVRKTSDGIEFSVNGLKWCMPNGWYAKLNADATVAFVTFSEGEIWGVTYSIYISYEGQYPNLTEYMDRNKTNGTFSRINVTGCTEAYICYEGLLDENDFESNTAYVICRDSVFKVSCVADDGWYNETQVEGVLALADFSSYLYG